MSAVVSEQGLRRALRAAVVVAALLLCCSGSAWGAVSWRISSVSNTTVAPGGQLEYVVGVHNVGDEGTNGVDESFTATFPTGLSVASVAAGMSCTPAAQTITCAGQVPAHGAVLIQILVDVAADASGVLTARYEVSGGGAAFGAQGADPVRISSADPGFGIDAFDVFASDASGSPFTQAGGHPSLVTTSIDFNTHTDPNAGARDPVEDVRDVRVVLPAGFVGSLTGLSECTIPELANGTGTLRPLPLCAPTSQVGVMNIRIGLGELSFLPVFNMVPPPGVPARFGVNVFGNVVVLDAAVIRSGGTYQLSVSAVNVPQGLAITGNTFVFWGVPSDPSHDGERACPGQDPPAQSTGVSCRSGAPPKAFFRNPTSCTGSGLPIGVSIDSWQDPGDFKHTTILTHQPPGYPFPPVEWGPPQGTTGCETVPFEPGLVARPIVGAKAGAPAAFAFDVTIPQDDTPSSTAQSDLRKAVVTLPQGVRVNPSSANGLGACTPEQIALETTALPSCPDSSKLGTVTIDTPLIPEQVTGHIYLATPFRNPFSSLVAVYIVASARGVVIKLPGKVSLDPTTGQITTAFDNNPQLPFSRLHVEFFGGNRTALTIPNRCGTYTTHGEFTGWNGRTATTTSSFTMTENAKGRPCPPEFSPRFTAGTTSNSAGAFSSFNLRFSRQDEDQEMRSLTLRLPRGLTGKIANADLCTDTQANTDTCPPNAKIGDATVGAGAGSNPFYIQNGRAYLTGPYNGAPFGVAIVVPAVAGPFDLGKVTVRSALFVDKHDATVRIVSDPFPTILQGIPLDVRDVHVTINKPQFILNPTGCQEKKITGTLTSVTGTTAHVAERFQAADCASLRFRPRLRITVGGRGHTARDRTSPLIVRYTIPKTDTNLRSVRLVLPTSINARLTTINDACTRAEFESNITRCAHARAGTVTAVTPLLRQPLKGNIYYVKNGRPIPDLFLALRGQVNIDAIGRITIPGGKRLASTIPAVPDVPLTSVTLRLPGDPQNASIGATRNLCTKASRRHKARIDYAGHNAKTKHVRQTIKVTGCSRNQRGNRRR